DQREIPNYWAYAKQFVLQDRMFEPNASWSLPAHLFMVSAWSAKCTSSDPMSCKTEDHLPPAPPAGSMLRINHDRKKGILTTPEPHSAWTDLTYLLHQPQVSWAYYGSDGTEPDCAEDAQSCQQQPQPNYPPRIRN